MEPVYISTSLPKEVAFEVAVDLFWNSPYMENAVVDILSACEVQHDRDLMNLFADRAGASRLRCLRVLRSLPQTEELTAFLEEEEEA